MLKESQGKSVHFTQVRDSQRKSGGKVSTSLRSEIVRESQGEKCPFHSGQGKSGKVREARGSQGKSSTVIL